MYTWYISVRHSSVVKGTKFRMELNYKLCEATLHDSLTKRRSSDRTDLNSIINIATDFAQLNFILDRFKRLAIGKNI